MSIVSVRYIVKDVDKAIEFYTQNLGFGVVMHPDPAFAILFLGDLHLVLSSPGAGGGGQALSDGSLPQPGGWNRFQIEVQDLEGEVECLKEAGAHFRGAIVVGVAVKQALLEDPSGNPVELFQFFSQDRV
jgi:catechol 2,3-dioxygenase-like lactoylglutathione lyase family enzyme